MVEVYRCQVFRVIMHIPEARDKNIVHIQTVHQSRKTVRAKRSPLRELNISFQVYLKAHYVFEQLLYHSLANQ